MCNLSIQQKRSYGAENHFQSIKSWNKYDKRKMIECLTISRFILSNNFLCCQTAPQSRCHLFRHSQQKIGSFLFLLFVFCCYHTHVEWHTPYTELYAASGEQLHKEIRHWAVLYSFYLAFIWAFDVCDAFETMTDFSRIVLEGKWIFRYSHVVSIGVLSLSSSLLMQEIEWFFPIVVRDMIEYVGC